MRSSLSRESAVLNTEGRSENSGRDFGDHSVQESSTLVLAVVGGIDNQHVGPNILNPVDESPRKHESSSGIYIGDASIVGTVNESDLGRTLRDVRQL